MATVDATAIAPKMPEGIAGDTMCTLKIAAVIPTFRRWPYMLNAVEELLAQTRVPDEIIIIDQTTPADIKRSERLRLEEITSVHSCVRYLLQWPPAVSKARNKAVLETGCDVLLYLDDDIIPCSDLVRNHIRHYENPRIDAVTGAGCGSGSRWIVPPRDFIERSVVQQAYTYNGMFSIPMQRISFMYGGNFSVRRSVLVSVSGWDEHILNYGDRDLGIRLAGAGHRIDYDPEALIFHISAPLGGTRVSDPRSPVQGWKRCVSIFYLAFRHLEGPMFIKYGLYRAARFSILLRQNALRPWRWPLEAAGFIKAALVAKKWAQAGLASPFISSRASSNV